MKFSSVLPIGCLAIVVLTAASLELTGAVTWDGGGRTKDWTQPTN